MTEPRTEAEWAEHAADVHNSYCLCGDWRRPAAAAGPRDEGLDVERLDAAIARFYATSEKSPLTLDPSIRWVMAQTRASSRSGDSPDSGV